MVNLHWSLESKALADFDPPHSGSLTFQSGEGLKNFTLTAKVDDLLEGEERFIVSLTSADNNADISVRNRDTLIIIEANEGSNGHIEVAEEYRTLYVAEPTPQYNGQQVSI